MKKLLTFAAAAALALSLVSCGSTGGSSKAAVVGYEHPMTYVLDIADAGDSFSFMDNSQYGESGSSTRQVVVDLSKVVKVNKVQKGDTVVIKGKITTDMDIDSLRIGIVDDSAAANYWTNLCSEPDTFIKDVKAGTPVELDYTFPVSANMKANFKVCFAYGEQNGGLANATVERVCESDIGTPAGDFVAVENHKEPKVYNFDLSKDLAYLELQPNYPWVNGVQDTMADPTNYQAIVAITNKFDLDADWPIPGDKIKVYWKTRSNNNIAALHCRVVENTAAVAGWWKEIDVNAGSGKVIAENIVADDVTEIEFELELADAPIEGLSLCIWNDLEESDGSSLLTYVRD
ncbi:MAG: hypothetical protein MJ181_02590 [Treponema sp.]|nr:hypothetical protein [Treponema sp.]